MNKFLRMFSPFFLSFASFMMIFSFQSANAAVSDEGICIRPFTLVLKQYYLDGEVGEQMIPVPVGDKNRLLEKYKDWNVAEASGNRIVLEKHVDDISPLLKANGFFGIAGDGTLSIYNGKPDKNQVIHSFFQIDIGKLEAKKQEELRRGIPVRSKDEFFQVLEAFQPYSLQVEE